MKLQDETKPLLLVVSPPCTMFSTMQNVNIGKMDEADVRTRTEAAVSHFAFAFLMCIRQSQGGRSFVIEHPVGASSWALRLTNLLAQCPNTRGVNFDFCMLGMKSSDDQGEALAKKRTKIVTNSKAIADELEKYQCDGLHRHVILESGRPKACERYPDKFCQVILEAFKIELVDECGEPLGEPCRASCGCMGVCDEKYRRATNVRRARSQGTVTSISGETWPPPPEEEVVPAKRNRPKLRTVSAAGTTGMPDERSARIPNEWRRTVDVTREFNAMIGSLNQLEASANSDL